MASESGEFEGLIRRIGGFFRLQWPVDFAAAAQFAANRWILAANGPGPRLAGEAVDVAMGREKVDVLMSTGYCGALDPTLQAGDVFVATRVQAVEAGMSFETRIPDSRLPFASGSLISSDRVIQTVGEKRALREQGAAAVEMEAAAVASRAAKGELPFYCVRVVTDRADEGFSLDFNTMRDSSGRFDRGRIVRAALRRPWVHVPRLLELRRRCRMGATALGDFLADCRF